MSHQLEQNILILNILSKIAQEKNKPLEKIKRLLLIQQSKGINRRFWEILDTLLPHHQYHYVGCCAKSGLLELCKRPPSEEPS